MGKNGGQILSDIDHKAQEMRSNLARLNEKNSQLLIEIEEDRKIEANLYMQLAKAKAVQSEEEDLPALLSGAEREAFRLLKQRDELLRRFDIQAQELQDNLKKLEEQRSSLNDSLISDRLALDNLRRETLINLQNKPELQEYKQAIEKTREQIERTTHKIPVIQQDHQIKTAAYHADPLFNHLWEVHYGTNSYNRSHFYRSLDRWVARICRYEQARRNYALLSALPQKFETHKNMLESKLESQINEKRAYIDKAVIEAGGQNYQVKIEKGQSELSALDADIAQMETNYETVLNEKNLIASGQDEISKAAATQLEKFLKNKTLVQLKIDAAATPSLDDDEIVRGLFLIEESIRNKETRLSEYQNLILREEQRLADIHSVRRTYKDRNYDRDTRGHDGQTFGVLLGQLLSGILTNRVFWRLVGELFEEVLEELDLDDVLKTDKKYYKSRRRERYRYDDD